MICVLGRTGQVASALAERARGREMRFFARDEADFTRSGDVVEALEKCKPSVVINAVAYTAVDQAESERDLAFQVNARTVGEVARFCARSGVRLVHYSTDYVYGGAGSFPHREDEVPAPLSVYGESKLAGESEILASGCQALIFRTSWVYHHKGKNFVRTMLRLGAEREELSVVSDQIGAPTSAIDIAEATLTAIERSFAGPWGVYNLAGAGETSWHEFATEIFKQARDLGIPLRVKSVQPIPSSAYPTPARRPLNSRLDQSKVLQAFDLRLPHWRESLNRCLREIHAKGVSA